MKKNNRKLLVLIILLANYTVSYGQIIPNNSIKTLSTDYHEDYLLEDNTNDSIYVFCGTPDFENTGSLSVNSSGGDITWYKFENHEFVEYAESSETIENLATGYYQAELVFDKNPVYYTAYVWVAQPFVSNEIIIEYPFETHYIFEENTYAKVSFWANHSYVSDVGFYLKSPDNSESIPGEEGVVQLCPTSSDWGEGAAQDSWTGIPWSVLGCSDEGDENTVCNSGNDFEDFTFSTHESPEGTIIPSGNPDYTPCICDLPTPITGLFGSVGSWEPIYTSQLNSLGWHVQIYDCEGADIGTVSRASLKFETEKPFGFAVNEYDTGVINMAINDNSCDPLAATLVNLSPTYNYVYYKLTSFYERPEICYTNINNDYKNVLSWIKPISDEIESFEIFRIQDEELYHIATVPYEDEAYFTDNDFDINSGVASYSVRSVGICDISSDLSQEHKNTHISLYTDTEDEWLIDITEYIGMTYTDLTIYRGNSTDNLEQIATIANTESTYTDNYTTGGEETFYRLSFVNTNNCDSNTDNDVIFSNIASTEDAIIVSNEDIDTNLILEVYPNPTKDNVFIEVPYEGADIAILDLNGRILFQKDNFYSSTISLRGLASGVYIVRIEKQGQIAEKKLIVK